MWLEFILYTKGNSIEVWKLYEKKEGYLKELLQYSMGFSEKNDFYPTTINK
jgi:hypothetical protein